MIDLETLDTKPTAQILSIGAVIFDIQHSLQKSAQKNIQAEFYKVIDLKSYNDSLSKSVVKSQWDTYSYAMGLVPDIAGKVEKEVDKLRNEIQHFTKSVDTEQWWSRQSEDARKQVFNNPESIYLKDALYAFCNWLKTFEYNTLMVWAHSPQFDCVIMEHAFRVFNIPCPWKFWNQRDTRTLYDVAHLSLKDYWEECKSKGYTQHNALSDAKVQAELVQIAYKHLHNQFK